MTSSPLLTPAVPPAVCPAVCPDVSPAVSPASVRMAVPRSWRRRRRPLPTGVLLHARAPFVPASGVVPELVLHVSEPVLLPLATWRAEALLDLVAELDEVEVEDDDVFELEGREVAYRRFSHRLGSADVISDQWAWRWGRRGVTLTGSVAREDYADYCDLLEAAAGTVEPAGTAGLTTP